MLPEPSHSAKTSLVTLMKFSPLKPWVELDAADHISRQFVAACTIIGTSDND
jgi:hypothetical protein